MPDPFLSSGDGGHPETKSAPEVEGLPVLGNRPRKALQNPQETLFLTRSVGQTVRDRLQADHKELEETGAPSPLCQGHGGLVVREFVAGDTA